MPQKKRKSAEEILGLAPRRPSAEEVLGIAPRPAPSHPPAPTPPTFLENVRNSIESGYRRFIDPALASTGEVIEGMITGNFRPAAEMAESAARGIVEGVRPPQPLQITKDPTTGQMVDARMAPPRDTRITELQNRQDARYQASSQGQYSRERLAELDARAAADPSIAGKATRGVTEFLTGAAPTLGAAILSRGSLPVVSLAAAAQSANRPASIGANVALNTLPLPAVAPILRRIRGGRGAATAVEETANARTTSPLEPVPNAPTTNPLPRTVLERAETQRLTEALPESGLASTPTAARGIEPTRVTASTAGPAGAAGSTLETAFQKLGTDDAQQISVMIANANRRFKKSATAAERQSSIEDYGRVSQLTSDEQRALGQVLPPYKFDPVKEGFQGKGSYSREVRDIPAGEPNAQLDANLRELDDFFTNQARVAQKPTSPFLHQVVGNSADDVAMVNVADMGLETAVVPTRPAGAKAVPRTISVDDITLGRDNLSKGRMFQVQEALKNGVKPEKRGVPLKEQVDPITVVPDPANPGKWIVEDDGNHRTAFLKLLGYTDEIPVKSFETKAQTAAIDARSASVSGPKVGETAALDIGGSGGGTGGTGGGSAGGGANPAQTITAAERTPVLEVISALRKAGLLTGVKTHLKNLGGNTAFQISEEVARIPGAIVDMMISPLTKRRTLTGPNFGAVARSAQEAATKGLREAKEIIRKGGTAEELAAQELKQINSGSKVLDTYINGTFRLLGAEDRVFRVYAMRRALEERARSAALTEIRQGAIPRGDYGKRVQEILKAPPEDLAAAAATDAEMAVFANDNLVSQGREAVRGVLQRTRAGRAADFVIDQIFPFVKTPTNVIARMLEYAGVTSGPKAAYIAAKAIVKRSMSEAEQRAFAQSFGRASVGAGLIALGVKGYQDGWLTGLMEDDPTRRARDAAAGRIPGAVKVGNTWHQITGFAPLASLLAIGATLARETDQEREGVLGPVAEVAGQVALDQPLLSGTKQIIEGVQQPGTVGGRVLGGLAGSFVPTAVSDIGELIDPQQRQASTIADRVQQRIPGLRGSLPERQNVLGRPVEDRATQIIDPTRSTTDAASSDPLFRELVRLDAGISGFRKFASETDEQTRAKTQRFGQLYSQYGQQLVSNPLYARASDELKLGALKVLNDRSKDLVTKGRERTAPQVLSAAFLLNAARRSAQGRR